MKRPVSRATAAAGVNYVRSIVEKNHSIFQGIDAVNDVGNDAYIEFVEEQDATGCCVAVQIKAGASYVAANGSHFIVSTDKDHFEYWNSHNLPIAMIVVDPTTGTAGWCDVTELLRMHPERITDGPYTLRIPIEHSFDDRTFELFRRHYLRYRERYEGDANLGLSLSKFADMDHVETCQDGLNALLFFHRQNPVAWIYLISCFRYFRGRPLFIKLLLHLTLLPGHPDIFWHSGNIIDEQVRMRVLSEIARRFGREEVALLLESIGEGGMERGTIGQAAYALIDVIPAHQRILEELAYDPDLHADARYWAIFLFIYERQTTSRKQCVALIDRYVALYPSDENDEELLYLRQTVEKGEEVYLS